MKRILFILLASFCVATSYSQVYFEEDLYSVNDSLGTNPQYVLDWCNGIIKKGTKNPEVYLLRSICAFYLSDYKLAIKSNDMALKYATDEKYKSGVYHIRGLIYLGMENDKRALKSFSNAIKNDTTLVESYIERVNLYLKKGNYELAVQDAKTVVFLKPRYVNLLLLAKCYFKQGELEYALSTVNFVIENKPDMEEAHQLLSEINNRLKEIESQKND